MSPEQRTIGRWRSSSSATIWVMSVSAVSADASARRQSRTSTDGRSRRSVVERGVRTAQHPAGDAFARQDVERQLGERRVVVDDGHPALGSGHRSPPIDRSVRRARSRGRSRRRTAYAPNRVTDHPRPARRRASVLGSAHGPAAPDALRAPRRVHVQRAARTSPPTPPTPVASPTSTAASESAAARLRCRVRERGTVDERRAEHPGVVRPLRAVARHHELRGRRRARLVGEREPGVPPLQRAPQPDPRDRDRLAADRPRRRLGRHLHDRPVRHVRRRCQPHPDRADLVLPGRGVRRRQPGRRRLARGHRDA